MSKEFTFELPENPLKTSAHAVAHMAYLDLLSSVERLHRLLLDVIKDEFERVGVVEINSVQGLLLFNIGDKELSAGELKSRGYYQGSNVSYNLRKLVDMDYMHHERCAINRRSVRVKLTEKGQKICALIECLFKGHAADINDKSVCREHEFDQTSHILKRLERYWTSQIRYIY